jgi:hypothetical protein
MNYAGVKLRLRCDVGELSRDEGDAVSDGTIGVNSGCFRKSLSINAVTIVTEKLRKKIPFVTAQVIENEAVMAPVTIVTEKTITFYRNVKYEISQI